MRDTNARISRLYAQLTGSSQSAVDETPAETGFALALLRGTATPVHLQACTEMVRDTQLQLAVAADHIRTQLAAGHHPTTSSREHSAACLVAIPPGDPVPADLAAQINELFETAWLQPWAGTPGLNAPIRSTYYGCLLTAALGSPDARDLRRAIAKGDYDDRPSLDEVYAQLASAQPTPLAGSIIRSILESPPIPDPQNPPADNDPHTNPPTSTNRQQKTATTRRDDAYEQAVTELLRSL